MNIELKQAAQGALKALENSQPHPSNPVIGLTKQDFIDHENTIKQLRAALQEAEDAYASGYEAGITEGWLEYRRSVLAAQCGT